MKQPVLVTRSCDRGEKRRGQGPFFVPNDPRRSVQSSGTSIIFDFIMRPSRGQAGARALVLRRLREALLLDGLHVLYTGLVHALSAWTLVRAAKDAHLKALSKAAQVGRKPLVMYTK
jgi:hypothetical protein